MVGKLSRIRVSSVTRTLPPRTSVGTLKSTRTSTRFPRTSRSRTESFAIFTPSPAPTHAPDRARSCKVLRLHARIPLAQKIFQHSHEHVHDADESCLGRKDPSSSCKLSHRKHIEACSTLQRR